MNSGWRRRAVALGLLVLLPVTGMADRVYRWTDDAGITHFSDIPPPGPPPESLAVASTAVPAFSAQGLRPGERTALQDIDRHLVERHRAAQQARQRYDHTRTERRRDCQERRARQRRTGNYPARKADTIYLRRHCW